MELRQVIDRPKHCVSKRLLVFAYLNNPYWFLNTLRESGYRVDVVGTPVRDHIAQRILLTTTKLILSNLASLQNCDFVISIGFARGLLMSAFLKLRNFLGIDSPIHVVISIGGALWPTQLRGIVRLLFSRDVVVCFTKAEYNFLKRQMGLTLVQFLPFGVDTEYWRPAPVHDEYVFSGGMTARDYETLFAAIRDIDFKFVVVAGSDPLTGKLEFDLKNIPRNTRLLMNIPQPKFKELLSHALFTVIPLKLTGYSAGHTSLVQALACGEAVIATHVPGTADYIIDGITGFFVSPGDPHELRERILQLLQAKELRTTLGENARRLAVEEFSEATLARHFCNLLQKLYEQRRRASSCFLHAMNSQSE